MKLFILLPTQFLKSIICVFEEVFDENCINAQKHWKTVTSEAEKSFFSKILLVIIKSDSSAKTALHSASDTAPLSHDLTFQPPTPLQEDTNTNLTVQHSTLPVL